MAPVEVAAQLDAQSRGFSDIKWQRIMVEQEFRFG
jgi:hypothetical protein